jgi:CHAT domain-containing protein/tetratricopeptide (TPR) repeat protein
LALGAAATMGLAGTGLAQGGQPPSTQDSFRLGDGSGVLCQVQSKSADPSMKSMFDRAYAIVCRDAAVPVGRLYALRKGADDPVARVAAIRGEWAQCGGTTTTGSLGTVPVTINDCTMKGAPVTYRAYVANKGRTVYIAEGLAGYDSALQLGLRTIVADRIVPGKIEVAVTEAGDPAAFARIQAGSLDLDRALAEGYRRNNSGSYAEAAEFFDTLLQRTARMETDRLGEYVVNRALQKSNLGEFKEADALFAEADKIPTSDPVQLRLRRNFRVLHLVNQQKLDAALELLAKPVAPINGKRVAIEAGQITPAIANEINSASPMARQLGAAENVSLTAQEKAAILDSQALQMRGTALRLQGDLDGAEAALAKALSDLVLIRDGRVTSIVRLRAQTMGELSAVDEARNNFSRAESLLRDGAKLLEAEYPASAALNAANARLAAYLGRRGQTADALALYKGIIKTMTETGASTTGFENLLAPYFALMLGELPKQPALINDFFLASETLIRPGVADTQAILARELSGGSDEAARLFRQSVNLTRDIERTRIELARLVATDNATPEDQARMEAARSRLATLEADQVTTQAKLGEYPRYRAISTQALTLGDLQGALKPDEAYLKTAIVGDEIYMIYATPKEATAYKAGIGAQELARKVDALRDTISVIENGQYLTYPFDLPLARELYVKLIQGADTRLAGVEHLIFEPDGALLQLPINLLPTEQAGVDAYQARLAKPGADEFDFTGVAWLGRKHEVSTAVSARAFRDVRNAAPSKAPRQYLGFGSNQPVTSAVSVAANRSAIGTGGIDCNWPLAVWDRPISPSELKTAASIVGQSTSDVITGPSFSDTTVIERPDLNEYRILHFATHGLVAAPRPECPARPALLTSFGPAGKSDGLLTFQEIYDLRLDADLVILSACDTAGKATIEATREAGVTTGGGAALDGLVRAFVGAGGRAVIASHWPAPDEYQATERIISGLFDAPAGTSVVKALRTAQIPLMDKPETSHPYYWADFSIIGDGAQPVLRPR